MIPELPLIGPWQLGLSLVFVLAAGAASLIHKLGLGRDLLVGTIRVFVQLLVMGYALEIIFGLHSALLVLAVYAVMTGFAAHIVRGRVKEKDVSFFGPTVLSMLAGYFLVTLAVTGVVLQSQPWWEPRVFLPIGGMVAGNSMTALALALERLFSDLRSKRAEVEMRLCLGADYREAGREIMAGALKAGMIPSIQSMMGVGVVFIPGMMTGQILAGADPLLAVRYQIVVMLMLVASTALTTLFAVHMVRNRCFGAAQQLVLRPHAAKENRL
jgi:putative ABC transport system permease protein